MSSAWCPPSRHSPCCVSSPHLGPRRSAVALHIPRQIRTVEFSSLEPVLGYRAEPPSSDPSSAIPAGAGGVVDLRLQRGLDPRPFFQSRPHLRLWEASADPVRSASNTGPRASTRSNEQQAARSPRRSVPLSHSTGVVRASTPTLVADRGEQSPRIRPAYRLSNGSVGGDRESPGVRDIREVGED